MSGGSILPVVRYADPAEAAGWLCGAYGFSIHHVAKRPDGGTAYIVLRFGENSVVVASHGSSAFDDLMVQPADVGNRSTQTCYLTVQDVDQHCARALEAGARIEVEPSDDGIGGRFYMCRDPEGHLWSFGAPLVGSTPAGPNGASEHHGRHPALSSRAAIGVAITVGVAVGCVAIYLGTNLASKAPTASIGGIREPNALSGLFEQDANAAAAKRLLVSEAAVPGLTEKMRISQFELTEAQQSKRNTSKPLNASEAEYQNRLRDSQGALDAAMRAKELAAQELEMERRRTQAIQRQLDEASQQLARLRSGGSTLEVEARRPRDASGKRGGELPGATQAGEIERGQLATTQSTEELLRERLRASERESRELNLRARAEILEMDKEAARARAARDADSARTGLAATQAKQFEPRDKLRAGERGTADAPARVARTAPPDTKVDEGTPRAAHVRPLPQHQLTQRKKWISVAAIKKAKAERQRLAAEAAQKAEAEHQRQMAEAAAAAARKAEEERQRLAAEAVQKAEAERQRQVAEAAAAAAARKAEEERQRLAAEAVQKAEAERQRQATEAAAAAARKAEEERQRLAAEATQKAEAERQRQAAEAAAAAARKAEEERQRLVAEAAQKAEVERQRQAAEAAAAAARKAEEERQRLAAEAAQKAEVERQRQVAEAAAAARKAEEERQRLAAEAAQKAEAERQRQAAEAAAAAAARKVEEERQRLAAEAAQKAEAERQRQAAEAAAAAARKAEEERQRVAAEAAQKVEAERQRQVAEAAAAARKVEEERQRVAAEAAQKAEAERQRQVAEASAAARKVEEERHRLAAEAAQKAEAERQRQVAEAAAAARKAEEERQRAAAEAAQKAEAERQRQAAEAAAAARKVEEERQRAAAEAAQKVEAERIAKEAVEAKTRADQETRRRTHGLTVTSEDGTRYLARGRALLKTGDVASARLLLERASSAGLADAAMELAETYDPATVARLSAVGLVGDREQARVWYMRAQALGSSAAAERLKSIVGQ